MQENLALKKNRVMQQFSVTTKNRLSLKFIIKDMKEFVAVGYCVKLMSFLTLQSVDLKKHKAKNAKNCLHFARHFYFHPT